jgi:hypothetical protein
MGDMDTTNRTPRPAAHTNPRGEAQERPDDGAGGKLAMPDLLTLVLWALLDRRDREGG